MKKFVLLSLLMVLAACATSKFQPKPGMSYADFTRQTSGYFSTAPRLVAAKGDVVVYARDNDGKSTYYWFRGGNLFKIAQGDDRVVGFQVDAMVRDSAE